MKNYVQTGETMEFTAGSTITGGSVVVQGGILGVAVASAASGARYQLRVAGVVEVPKTAAQAWTEGAVLYWSGTAFTTTVTGAIRGCAAAAAASADTVGLVRLNGVAA